MHIRSRAAGALLTLLAALPVAAGDAAASGGSGQPDPQPDPQAGKALAEKYCGRCHATGPADESPLPQAIPFRELRTLYPVESLAEALAEGMVTGHEDMPEFRFEPGQIDDLLSWLGTLDGTPGDGIPGQGAWDADRGSWGSGWGVSPETSP